MKEMEGFGKGFSPSRSTGSGENNENDSSQDNILIPKFQIDKKVVVKNFMLPTISAASKAAAPRKKILAERNENSSNFDGQNQKISNSEMGKSPRNSTVSYFSRSPSRIVSSSNYASDDDCDKDYDPSTNYLSPRPKYLRFNPNRRREIFDRLEKEGREDLKSSLDSEEFNDEEESLEEEIEDSSFTPPKESVINEKKEENTKEGDDYEEKEEEEEEEEEEEDELEEERGGWCLKGVLKLLFTLIACFLSTSYICTMNSPTPSPTQQAILSLKDGYLMIKKQTLEVINMRMHDAGFVEVDVGDGFGEVEGVGNNEDDTGSAEESVEAEVAEDNVEYPDLRDNVVGNEKEDSQDKVDDKFAEIEVVRVGELLVETDYFEHFVGPRSDEIDSFVVEEVESSYPDSDENNVAKTDEGDQDSCGCGLENELEGSNQLQDLELPGKPISEEETPQESKGVDETEPLEDIASHEKLTNSVHQVDETGCDNEVIIAVSVGTVILTSLALVYRAKKARNVSGQEPEPQNFAVEEEKVANPVLPLVKRKIEFFSRPSLSHTMEEASREPKHHIGAPHVELIGEIAVGQMSSRKHKMSESEKKNATFSTPIQPSQLEYSTSNSSSYGSFTTETKILKKEGGQSGGAMVEVTPVRRSTRLRNRAAAMSP